MDEILLIMVKIPSLLFLILFFDRMEEETEQEEKEEYRIWERCMMGLIYAHFMCYVIYLLYVIYRKYFYFSR